MTKIYNNIIQAVEFPGSERRVWRQAHEVIKVDPERLTVGWRQQMYEILGVWRLPVLTRLFSDGYATEYIEGTDLHGNKPFEMDPSNQTCSIPVLSRFKALQIFNDAMRTGEVLGYTLGDITCGNMLVDKQGEVYLIDYEVIVPYPLDETYQNIWQNTLRILFG